MAASFEDRVAAAQAASKGEPAPKAAAPAAASTTKTTPQSSDTSDSEEDSDSSTEEDSTDIGETSTDEEAEEDSATVDAAEVDPAKALELLTAGDIPGMIKALGGDPKLADTTDRKFRAMREMAAKSDKKEAGRKKAHENAVQHLTKMSADLTVREREFRRDNAFLQESRKAVAEKNWPAVAKSVVAFTGLDIATLTQKLASGMVGLTPEDKQVEAERAKLAKERQDFEASKKGETTAKETAQKRAVALDKVKTALAAHPFLKVSKGFEKRAERRADAVFESWEKTWDGSRFTKTPKQVADELHAEFLEEARASGIAPVVSKKKVAKRPDEVPPTKGHVDAKGDLDKSKTFEQRVALAQRQASIGRRS